MTPPTENDTTAREARVRRFVDEYVIDHNGVRAYLAAFGRETAAGRPRSYNAACVEASKLLKNPEVRKEIRAAQFESRKRCRVSADRIVDELAAIAFSTMSDYFDMSADRPMTPLPIREISPLARKALRKLTYKSRVVNGITIKTVDVQCHSKLAALGKLYDHLGMGQENEVERLLSLLPPALLEQVTAVIEAFSSRRKSRDSDLADRPITIVGEG
jgi:hypothetical protein